jgi:hypothetical protein
MRASEFLIESLDTDIEYKVVDSDRKVFTTTAEIDGSVIVFEAGAGGIPGRWSIVFYQYNQFTGRFTYEKTGSGSELAIFSFVMKSLTEFLSKYKPYVVHFTADKAESSRVRLYSRMIKKYADRLGYTMSDAGQSPAVEKFRLTRKDGEGQYA